MNRQQVIESVVEAYMFENLGWTAAQKAAYVHDYPAELVALETPMDPA